MQNKVTVLVAESEAGERDSIAAALQAAGCRPLTAESGSNAEAMITSHCPDAMLLDRSLSDMDGLDVLRTVRQWSDIPIIILSARSRSTEKEEARALDMGADDYIMKPVGALRLLARLRAALRHSMKMETGHDLPAGLLQHGDLTINLAQRSVAISGKELHLTQNEYRIVLLLAKHPGEVLTYSNIIGQVWGHFAVDDRQILRVNMANIRKKMERDPSHPEYIVTEVGVGYRMP